ncbi:MAG: hypothetical protein QM537_03505, partial [Candidatus Symbiobacter sp.]|nr:hypothetical protein [Candidatus Symbiobacter sp.]
MALPLSYLGMFFQCRLYIPQEKFFSTGNLQENDKKIDFFCRPHLVSRPCNAAPQDTEKLIAHPVGAAFAQPCPTRYGKTDRSPRGCGIR